MNVCFFGIFNPEYSRNMVLIRGFKENGYNITLCRVNPAEFPGIRKYIQLFREFRKIRKEKFSKVIVAFPGHTVVWLARLLFRSPVIFDVFVSLYDSEIDDRRKNRKFSFKAFYYRFMDWYSMHLANVLLIDTKTHRNFISNNFSVPQNKFIVAYVGSDDTVVYPIKKQKDDDKCIVHFHGTGTPLQGTDLIIASARLLESQKNIEFNIYGIEGINTTNTRFFQRFPFNQISSILSRSDIVLGIFGDTVKAGNVIPNKVFEGLAVRKPVITVDSMAARELLVNNKNALLCKNGSAEDLAESILRLAQNHALRDTIAMSGYQLFIEKLTPEIIVKDLLEKLPNQSS